MEAVKTDLKASQSAFRVKAGAKLEIDKLRKAVVDAGFTPTWIRFEALGTLVKQDGTYGLQVTGTEQVIPLEPEEQLGKLLEAATMGQTVSITGLIPEGKTTARIEKFEIR